MFSHFSRTPTCDRHRQTHGHGIYRTVKIGPIWYLVEYIETEKEESEAAERYQHSWCLSADTLLSKAETTHAIKYVTDTEANSLRRTVKEKTAEVQTVELQLGELLQQLLNN